MAKKKGNEEAKSKKKEVEEGKTCAILTYFVVGIIWYFADEKMRKNSFAKFHTQQSLVLWIVSIVGSLILGIIPVVGWIIWPIFEVVILIFGIIGIINALNGNMKHLPIIGKYGDRFTF